MVGAILFFGYQASIQAESPLWLGAPSPDKTHTLRTPEERLKADVRFLASDDMRGRGPGTGGLDRAAEYIAQRFRDLGLQTDLFNDSPFQEFTVPGEVQASKPEKNRLQFTQTGAPPRTLTIDGEFRPMSLGANQMFSGPLAFVGYGIAAKGQDWAYDEYAGVDVQGKVVVMLRKEPQQTDKKSVFDGLKSSKHAYFGTKIANAKNRGAIAVIFVNDRITASNSRDPQTQDEQLPGVEDAGKAVNGERIPVLFMQRRILDGLLATVDPNLDLDSIETGIDADLKPRSIDLKMFMVQGEVMLEKTTQRAKNVIACIPGAGALADETLVIGAHYDHVGMGGQGSLSPGIIDVHNGADDNASGTSALMEVARRFVDQPIGSAARRRLVFIGFTGEERGLLGSRHYVKHPRFAIESTTAMINLDMVGRMSDRQLIVFGTGTGTGLDKLVDETNAKFQFNLRKQIEGLGPSDHQPFYEQKIPVLHLFTGLHEDYHRPSDDFEKINISGMVGITDMVYQLGVQLATVPQRPSYLAVKGRANIRLPVERKARLGVRMGLNEAGSHVVIDEVMPGSAAERAGLQSEDWIVSMDGQLLSNPEKISDYLAKKKEGDQVELIIQRGDSRLEISAILGSP
jgi:hypothetical protein